MINFPDAMREQAIITNSILELLQAIGTGRSLPPPAPPTPPENHEKVILFLASNPSETSRLQLEKEFARIHSRVQDSASELKLFSEWAVTPGRLQEAILKHRPNIIHFSGHGVAEAGRQAKTGDIALETGPQSGIVLQDAQGRPKVISSDALTNLFKTIVTLSSIKVEVVILNACHQEAQARAIAQHVPYVVGTNTAIDDEVAIEFSTGFYRALASRDSGVELAFELAKTNVMLEGLEGSEVPVMYVKGGGGLPGDAG